MNEKRVFIQHFLICKNTKQVITNNTHSLSLITVIQKWPGKCVAHTESECEHSSLTSQHWVSQPRMKSNSKGTEREACERDWDLHKGGLLVYRLGNNTCNGVMETGFYRRKSWTVIWWHQTSAYLMESMEGSNSRMALQRSPKLRQARQAFELPDDQVLNADFPKQGSITLNEGMSFLPPRAIPRLGHSSWAVNMFSVGEVAPWFWRGHLDGI